MTTASNKKNSRDMVTPPTLISSVPAYYQTNSTVGPLCPTFWGQDYPFNYYCPLNAGAPINYLGRSPAGCVPVAVAQLMYFWKHSSNYYFRWSTMPLTKLAAGNMPITSNDVPELINFVGGAMFTSYGANASSTLPANISLAFNLFNYTSFSSTASLSSQQWSGANDGTTFAGLLSNEIQTNRRPCIVSGWPVYNSFLCCGILPSPGGSGHTWVCDGSNVTTYYSGTTNTYKDFYGNITTQTYYSSSQVVSLLHMNWGWESATGETDEQNQLLTNNGWYDCSVNYTQASNASDNFQYFQIVNYNIHP